MPARSKKTAKNNEVKEKDRLLLAILPRVPALGLTEEAVLAGAKVAKMPAARALAQYPALPVDLVTHMADWADRQMLAAYARRGKNLKRVRDRVALGVRLRLEALTPYRAAVREEVRTLARPWLMPLAAKLLFTTCDAIWTAAGDTSTDYNYYTKRGLLAGVLTATTLRWLGDESEEQAATWDFLDRRIDNALQLGKAASCLKQGPEGIREGLREAAGTLKDKIRDRRRAA